MKMHQTHLTHRLIISHHDGSDQMNKPKVLIALLGEPSAVERILIRRCIDTLVFIFSDEKQKLASSLIEKYSILGIQVIPIHIQSLNFTSVLSSILRVLNQHHLDECSVEFSISSGNPILIMATCVIAVIINSSILYVGENGRVESSEVWPSKLVNISYKKKQILDFLENYDGPINQKDIAGEIGISQSGISRHIYDLELAGYVTRTRVAKKKVIEISDLGSVIIHQKEIRKRRIWAPYMIENSGSVQPAS